MANPLTAGTIKTSVQCQIAGASISPQGAATSSISAPVTEVTGTGESSFGFGTTSGNCDILCGADYVIAAGGTVTIDIYANGLPNVYGGTADFRKLKSCYFGVVSGGDSAGVLIGGAASNAHPLFFVDQSDKWRIKPGQVPLPGSDAAGVTVDATHRNIKIENLGAAEVRVRVQLGGTSV